MSQPIAYGRALYYPYIQLKNNLWLKTAALYYDGIDRIVPKGYDTRDNRTVKSLNDHFDFVHDIDPKAEAENIAHPFLNYLHKEFATSQQRNTLFKRLGITLAGQENFSIHMNKMGTPLREKLPLMGLAAPKDKNNNQQYEFDPATGAMYMTYLANHLASQRRLPVITDDPMFQPLIRGMQSDNNPADVSEKLAALIIKTAVPENLENIPMRRIIRFRKHHDEERSLFYKEINTLVADLKDVTDEKTLSDILNYRAKFINIAAKNLKRSYTGVGIAAATGLLSLSVPAVAVGLGAKVAGAAIVAMASGKTVAAGIDYQKAKYGSPYSYVLSLNGRLKSDSLFGQLLKGKIIF